MGMVLCWVGVVVGEGSDGVGEVVVAVVIAGCVALGPGPGETWGVG